MSKEKDVWELSRVAYDIKRFNSNKIHINGNNYYVLDRIDNGVNAVTYGTLEDYNNLKEGHPEKVKHALVAYRGSEPLEPQRIQDYGGGWDGLNKGASEVIYDWLGTDYAYLIQKKAV
ncbi:hypothetical protein [Listeria fleischmannii]|uniref:Uncharacterized protein n=1 Tax=Listeria fleischmannii FSL S10-1203 TaxID=1265822 RepID=W7D2T0_9LIST|nr:hypothetical protein [Listeria fleischmannii]EUJ43255.1 hypothetical protein MCOL2_20593 [Listeria fleischmannii FSL S10-1203]